MIALHLGQGPFCPANLSATLNRFRQPGQVTVIGMADQRGGGSTERGEFSSTPCSLLLAPRFSRFLEFVFVDGVEAFGAQRFDSDFDVVDHQRHGRPARRTKQEGVDLRDVHFGGQ